MAHRAFSVMCGPKCAVKARSGRFQNSFSNVNIFFFFSLLLSFSPFPMFQLLDPTSLLSLGSSFICQLKLMVLSLNVGCIPGVKCLAPFLVHRSLVQELEPKTS